MFIGSENKTIVGTTTLTRKKTPTDNLQSANRDAQQLLGYLCENLPYAGVVHEDNRIAFLPLSLIVGIKGFGRFCFKAEPALNYSK
jgi:hypothetical protein